MNKATLALKIAEKLDVPKKQAEDFIATFQEVVTQTLVHDEDVTIAGFGTFSSRIRAARKGVNPRNPSQVIDVPAVKVPKFKAGKALKDTLKASTPGGSKPAEEPQVTAPSAPSPEPAAAQAPAAAPETNQAPTDSQAPTQPSV